MIYEYTITERDYLDCCYYHAVRTKSHRRQIAVIRVGIPILIALLCRLLVRLDSVASWIAAGIALAAAAYWFLRASEIYRKSYYRNNEAMLRKGKGQEFLGPVTLSLWEDGIEYADARHTADLDWHRIEGSAENGETIYLYAADKSVLIVPPAAFRSPAERNEFLDMIKERCSA